MRQLFTLRFWMTLIALLALVGVATLIASRSTDDESALKVGSPLAHEVDLIALVDTVHLPPGFAIVDGRANADLFLTLDVTRTMLVKAGTPGEVDCPRVSEPSQCIVAADLLGDGVLWFSLVPGTAGGNVALPAVLEILPGGWLRLANDWVVQHAPRVQRSCVEDTTSLTNFIQTYGDSATSTYNVEQQRVVRVTCPRAPLDTTTTSTPSTASTPISVAP